MLDVDMKKDVNNLIDSSKDGIVGYKLSSRVYVILTEVSTLSPLGWIHVYLTDLGKIDCGLRLL